MTKYNYEELNEKEDQRLELDNLPEHCMYCGYRMRPSASMDSCSEYCKGTKVAYATSLNLECKI